MTTYTAIKSLKYHSSIPQCLKKKKKKRKKNKTKPKTLGNKHTKKKKRMELEERIHVFQIILWLT